MPPSSTYYSLIDVHGAGAQRSDPKAGSVSLYYLGLNQAGDSVYGQGPQGDVIRINNYVRLVRSIRPTDINEYRDDDLFDIYPNPVSDACTISLNDYYSQIKIEIFNSIGCKVKEINSSNIKSVDINLSDVPYGIYYLSATNNQGITFNKKLIIAK